MRWWMRMSVCNLTVCWLSLNKTSPLPSRGTWFQSYRRPWYTYFTHLLSSQEFASSTSASEMVMSFLTRSLTVNHNRTVNTENDSNRRPQELWFDCIKLARGVPAESIDRSERCVPLGRMSATRSFDAGIVFSTNATITHGLFSIRAY